MQFNFKYTHHIRCMASSSIQSLYMLLCKMDFRFDANNVNFFLFCHFLCVKEVKWKCVPLKMALNCCIKLERVDFLAPFPVFIFFIAEVICHLPLSYLYSKEEDASCNSWHEAWLRKGGPQMLSKVKIVCVSYEHFLFAETLAMVIFI